jgi:hypothetical protein
LGQRTANLVVNAVGVLIIALGTIGCVHAGWLAYRDFQSQKTYFSAGQSLLGTPLTIERISDSNRLAAYVFWKDVNDKVGEARVEARDEFLYKCYTPASTVPRCASIEIFHAPGTPLGTYVKAENDPESISNRYPVVASTWWFFGFLGLAATTYLWRNRFKDNGVTFSF